MMKTKAAVLHQVGGHKRPYSDSKPLKIEEIEIGKPGKEEVVVQIKAAGLCHSDLSVIDGNRPRPMPMVLGHEAAGIIVELGQDVKGFEVGDHVVFAFLPSCGHCEYCMSGRAALCNPGAKANNEGVLLNGDIKIKNQNGEAYHHHLGVSGFAGYAVASIYSLVKIDRSYPFEIAALFGCAVMTGVGAVVHTAQVHVGESVLVVGLGGVGLSAILGAKAAGASKIIAADVSPSKLDMAKAFGATHTLNSGEERALEELKQEITTSGVDKSVEFAGAMPALDFAFNATKKGGVTVTGALPHPDARLSLNPLTLVGQEKTLKGCYLGSCVPSIDIPNFLELYKNGNLPVDKLITHRLKLEDINEGFERLASGEAIRQVIIFD
ncbi:zinc-dependent alcohol dehydrogenase family protein [Sphingobacterium faecale]|uniref:Zinc-dependent alcohol dehydrogenase family protein n=1 Tax=Sphingobacterium faecale TaxID=2803775 RepID=A0ABS1QXP3_9SPHI|nr:zinc-dependent alcohol dehydrogenase family protein [Sphingobacterium faecale]MBL1407183.1 zinc-dependent alcohol dehydrogenase family protein [Sphingobacterium faecale]